VLRLPGGRELVLTGLRALAGQYLHAEAEHEGRTCGLSFGPMHGAVSEQQVIGAAKEAGELGIGSLFVVGLAFGFGVPERAAASGATLVHATADLLLGDLLKTTRGSEIFAVTGAPDFDLEPAGDRFVVRLGGVDVFDPIELAVRRLEAADVPAWFLDWDFDGRVFRIREAHFPRTKAFEALRRALGDGWDENWGRGTISAPFEGGAHRMIAIKVVDDRGHELVATRALPGPTTGARSARKSSSRA
jgi:adenine-specific DNA-methyltransferase